jgi:hypothetical protein
MQVDKDEEIIDQYSSDNEEENGTSDVGGTNLQDLDEPYQ